MITVIPGQAGIEYGIKCINRLQGVLTVHIGYSLHGDNAIRRIQLIQTKSPEISSVPQHYRPTH